MNVDFLKNNNEFNNRKFKSNTNFKYLMINSRRNISYVYYFENYFYLSSLGTDIFTLCYREEQTIEDIIRFVARKYGRTMSSEYLFEKTLFQIRYLCKNELLKTSGGLHVE